MKIPVLPDERTPRYATSRVARSIGSVIGLAVHRNASCQRFAVPSGISASYAPIPQGTSRRLGADINRGVRIDKPSD